MADDADKTDPAIPALEDKPAHLIIFWADTMEPLTHEERVALFDSHVGSVIPAEVLIRAGSRFVIITAAGTPGTPPVPPRKAGDQP